MVAAASSCGLFSYKGVFTAWLLATTLRMLLRLGSGTTLTAATLRVSGRGFLLMARRSLLRLRVPAARLVSILRWSLIRAWPLLWVALCLRAWSLLWLTLRLGRVLRMLRSHGYLLALA